MGTSSIPRRRARRARTPALALLVLVAAAPAAGCATAEATAAALPAAAAAPATELGLTPGESMAFELRVGGVLAGEATVAVGELGEQDGRRTVTVSSRAATAGAVALFKRVVDQATTVIDVESGAPLRLESLVEMGDRGYTATGAFRGNHAEVTFTRQGAPRPERVRFDFRDQPAYDTHAAMAQLRGWRAAPGARRSVWVIGGRRLWRVDLTYVGVETIGTAIGNRRAVRLAGASYRARPDQRLEDKAPSRSFEVWLSDDADRVPLQVRSTTELGDVDLVLTDYQRSDDR